MIRQIYFYLSGIYRNGLKLKKGITDSKNDTFSDYFILPASTGASTTKASAAKTAKSSSATAAESAKTAAAR